MVPHMVQKKTHFVVANLQHSVAVLFLALEGGRGETRVSPYISTLFPPSVFDLSARWIYSDTAIS